SSLATIVEMVSAGYGITLLPEMSLGVDGRGRDLTLVRFVDPEPFRTIGLVWRQTSPRTQDFEELGRLVQKAWTQGPLAAARSSMRPQKEKAAVSEAQS
ncbi:LysR substrate-binding domain-containing protein, partial [Salmonella sp. s50237]|uniref:LysR substrate-binding domain-containing protein n=1 Tax=Salmonella sp. s50237 TaxID=3159649 RepID=UPI00398011BE